MPNSSRKKRNNPFDLVSGILSGAAGHIGGKLASSIGRKKKKKNPEGSFIPVRVIGNKVQMRVPNKNPGTLKQARVIARKMGLRNPEDLRFLVKVENNSSFDAEFSTFAKAKKYVSGLWSRGLLFGRRVQIFDKHLMKVKYSKDYR